MYDWRKSVWYNLLRVLQTQWAVLHTHDELSACKMSRIWLQCHTHERKRKICHRPSSHSWNSLKTTFTAGEDPDTRWRDYISPSGAGNASGSPQEELASIATRSNRGQADQSGRICTRANSLTGALFQGHTVSRFSKLYSKMWRWKQTLLVWKGNAKNVPHEMLSCASGDFKVLGWIPATADESKWNQCFVCEVCKNKKFQ